MSVVVNDFELLVEPPAPDATPAGGDGATLPASMREPEPAPPRSIDVRDALAQQARRAERLRAH
jgi:hypothetical protein